MKDINFFLPYLDKRKVKFNNKFFLSIIFIVFALAVTGYGVYNYLKIERLQAETDLLQAAAEDPKTVEKVEEIRVEEEELNRFILEVEEMRNLKLSVAERDVIGSGYIDNIIKKRPADLFLTSIYLSPDSTSLMGVSSNRMSVAEFAKGLEMFDSLGEIFIANISKEESGIDYNFNIETSLLPIEEEEVVIDGDGGEEENTEEAGEED